MIKESTIQRQIMVALGARQDMKIWRQNTGQAWTGNDVFIASRTGKVMLQPGDVVIKNGRPIGFGTPGMSDLGLVLSGGRIGQIEVKGPHGKLSEPQARWGHMIQTMGGLFIVARSVEDALRGVEKA